jgi:hypothetical protein
LTKAAALRARSGWRYRGNVALRTLAGTVGAYAVAALAAMLLARTLPMGRLEAVTVATMFSYLFAPAASVWAFLARGPWVALGGVIVLSALLAGLVWTSGGFA